METKEYIVGYCIKGHPSLKCNLYKIAWKGARNYAEKIGRELAEGPTLYVSNSHYGSLEVWPLVYKGDT